MPANPLNAAAAIAVEREKVRDQVWPQFEQDDVLLTMIPDKTDQYEVSDRLVRFPMLMYPGAQFNQFSPDGGGLGPVGGSKYEVAVTTPVYFSEGGGVTAEAEWTTDSKEKSVVDVYKDEFKINLKAFRHNIDALLSSSDGSGTLATVSSASTSGQLTLNNVNTLQQYNTYQVWSSLGGTFRGVINLATVDPVANIAYLQGTAPAGTTAGDLIIVNGASGSANSSLNGVPALNLSSNSGQFFGINRTSYPGVLTTPYVNAASGALTPQIVQKLQSYMQRKLGVKILEEEESVCSLNVDQVTAWEVLGLVTSSTVATAFTDQNGGKDERMDYMKKKRVQSLAGHPMVTNLHALPARVDFIVLKHWFRVYSKTPALYDVDGITVFPSYASDGSVATQSTFYYVTGLQVANDRPGSGSYVDTLSVPFS